MPVPSREEAVAAVPLTSWWGSAWRIHASRYEATSYGGSERVSGRYHRAPDGFPPEECFPALYTALAPEIAIAEALRHTRPDRIARLRESRLSELLVALEAVLDARDTEVLGIVREELLAPRDHSVGQRLGAAAVARGCDGLLVPSATGLGDNLIIFPRVRQGSPRLQVAGHRDLTSVYYVDQ